MPAPRTDADPVTQGELRVEVQRIDSRFDRLEKLVVDGFAGIGQTLATINTRLDGIERRLGRLEERP